MPQYRFEYKTTGTNNQGLDGAYWYDTGTLNEGESVYYDRSGVYAYWNDGTDWLISAVADVGGSPTDYFKYQDYPETITVVGAGEAGAIGTYSYAGINFSRPHWEAPSGWFVVYLNDINMWNVASSISQKKDYYIHETDYLPPKTGYTPILADAPPPTLEYTVPALNVLLGKGAYTGTITISTNTIVEAWDTAENGVFQSLINYIETGTNVTVGGWNFAEQNIFESIINYIETATDVTVGGWNMAEQTVYESLAAYIGNTDGTDCFRGYLPINEDGELKAANVWMITSGGTSGDFDIERTYGATGNWCSVLTDAELTGVFENRTTAMNFCGAVMAWLKSTNNLNQVGNVNWCHLAALPEAPVERIIKSHRYWQVSIPLEILYLTESAYT